MKEKILNLLRLADGYLSGQQISNTLGISRAAVWKSIEKLREEGYAIASAQNRGYCLVQTTDRLQLREILSYLPPDFPWRDRITYTNLVDSTNNRLKAMAAAGAPHGTVLIADAQSGGRGRRGRSFLSPPGMGIYLSVLLRPEAPPDRLMHLTCAVAEAVCQAVEITTHFRPGIKWANDLIGDGKKLAGILTELSIEAESGHVQYAVVGIGINCCQTVADFPPELSSIATSLSIVTRQKTDRNRLAAAIVGSLANLDARLLDDKPAILAAYRSDCVTLNQEVLVSGSDGTRHGFAVDIDDNGALLVRFADGHTEAVNSGEVSVRGVCGYL